ncbi:outer membrane protein PgaA [Rubripirellula obstinata]|uniref:Outer membrane protein PgaA n=1 Tax=Rubripirellula obstinata TaxID=406547 RepID=A0A5B1C934_9BACT|nr:tetratricopeptide repeat protein [Rubripirellula obstinata]KAA1257658.1 outer membrane protein PgaA [Rubripirellula obstinata]
MHDPYAKIQLLISQSRFELAEREIRRSLTEDPDDSQLQAFLAICLLVDKSRLEEATDAAKKAVAGAPDEPYTHYVLTLVWDARGQTDYALDSIEEAIRLDPETAEYYGLQAQMYLMKGNYNAALKSATAGLSVNPENIDCGNLRSMALERLGRTDEAMISSAQTLARDPDNAGSHAAHGHTLLNAGRHKEAQVAFREALRLNPSNEFARDGMMNALNSRSIIFRGVYRYYVWISRLGQKAGMMLIFGAWILVQVLNSVADSVPAIRPFVTPIIIAYVLFAVMSWVATPLFNTFLRFHAFGRHLLTRKEFWASNILAASLGLSVFSILYSAVTGNWSSGLLAAMYWFALSVPIAATFSMLTTKRFAICAAATVVVTLLPIAGLVRGLQLGSAEPFYGFFQYFYYGILGIQIVSQVMNARPVRL